MKEQPDQLELDFNRGAKLWILRRVSERNVITARMLMVLRAIDDQARDQAETVLSMAQIGGYSGQSRDTAKRGVADLIRNRLLIKTPHTTGNGHQANKYQIVWSALQAIADGEAFELIKPGAKSADSAEAKKQPAESAQVFKPAMGHSAPPPVQAAPSDGAQCPAAPVQSAPSILYSPLRKNPLPIPLASDWAEVESDLIDLGLGYPRAAITRAQANGCSPGDIGRLIQHAGQHPGAWGPGAIFSRVASAQPGGDPAAGWPKPSAEWEQQQKRQAQQQLFQQNADRAAQRHAERQARQERNRQLDQELGSVLDEMSHAERVELARTWCKPMLTKLRKDPQSYQAGGCRLFLLDAIQQREADACRK